MTHGTSALALLLLLAGPGPARADPLDGAVLSAHNRLRAELGLPLVQWDAGLAAGAAGWAAALARAARFDHSPASLRQYAGENLWMGPASAGSAADAVARWAAERADYIGGVFPFVSRSGRFETVAHYTQMVWRETSRVGCGRARSGAADIVVCRYSAAGNVVGRAAY